MTIEARIREVCQRTDDFLEGLLPEQGDRPQRLHEAMRYSVLGGGKRMRPLLVHASAMALSQHGPSLDHMAAAVELIHAYSLIHDDLPAMDNDDLRRGIPTCHRRFDEATAILAGDALQALAFEILATMEHCRTDTLVLLARACGSQGMAGGQAIDLDSVGRQLSADDLATMHGLKTGALIQCAVCMPAVQADCEPGITRALEVYGHNVGLAFQIHDDILDVEGDTRVIGKPRGSDANQNKPTFPACIGLEPSRQMATELLETALQQLQALPGDTRLLDHLARYTISRDL